MSTIHPVINQVGAWRLHPFGLNIMTTNQSEAFNSVLKRLQQYKEVPVDVMAMSLFRLSQFHMCEIQRGHAGNGNYMLRSGIARVTTDADHADPGSPSSIVDRLIDAAQPPPAAADSTVLTQSDSQATNSHTVSEDESTDLPVATAEMPAGESAALTVRERAAAVVNNGKIELNCKLGVFTVIGTTDPRVVRLFPQASYSCAADAACYHVTAARMSVGLVDEPQARRINLTRLRRNQRKRPDKTAGRKRPRVNDVDVEPAGDVEPGTLRQLQDAVMGSNDDDDDARPATQQTQTTVNSDVCDVCSSVDPPPAGKRPRRTVVDWIGCDQCPRWFHNVCVRVKSIPDRYVCGNCE